MERINRLQNVLEFEKYIKDRVDNDSYYSLLKLLKDNFDNVYIYSGIIRNYFIGYEGSFNDIDIVVKDKNKDKEEVEYIDSIIKNNIIDVIDYGDDYSNKYIIGQNKKIKIDIWGINNSVGFRHFNSFDTNSIASLINTAFFNCSEIAYDCKKRWFTYNQSFIDFLDTKILEAFRYNTYKEYKRLNVLKIFEYYYKYDIKPSDTLMERFLIPLLMNKNKNEIISWNVKYERINNEMLDKFFDDFNILERIEKK